MRISDWSSDVCSSDLPDGVLRAMFAPRKSVFVDLLKWHVPVLEGRYEIDQFDDEYARYLILADSGDGHLGSARLLPTMRPQIGRATGRARVCQSVWISVVGEA